MFFLRAFVFLTAMLVVASSCFAQKQVSMTKSKHPSLSSPLNLQTLFNNGAALLLADDDGAGSGTADDVSFNVNFTITNASNSTFPNQSGASHPANERYDYRLAKYNVIMNDTVRDQLLRGRFANVKQVQSINGATGVAFRPSNPERIILTQSAIASTSVHEWGHCTGLRHRTGTDFIMHPSINANRKEINRDEKTSMQNH